MALPKQIHYPSPYKSIFFSEDEIGLGRGDDITAIFFLKNFYDYTGVPSVLSLMDNVATSTPLAAEFIGRNAFLLNAAVYQELKTQLTQEDSPNNLLHIIAFFTGLSSGRPVLNTDLLQAHKDIIDQMLNNMEVEDKDKAISLIKSYYDQLFDFPISTKDIQLQKAGGTFTLASTDGSVTNKQNFAYYQLSLQYSTLNMDGDEEEMEVVLDWPLNNGDITDNIIQFSFSDQQLIVPAEPHEVMTVYVKGPDGMIIWSKDYRTGSAAVQAIHITLPFTGTGTTNPPDRTKPNPKRLQGQLLDMSGGKINRKDAIILIQEKAQLVKDMKLKEVEADDFVLSDYVEAVSTYGALWITIWDEQMEFAPNSWIVTKVMGTNAEDGDNGHLYYISASDGKSDDDSLEDFSKIVKDIADKKSSNYSVLALYSTTRVPKKETKK